MHPIPSERRALVAYLAASLAMLCLAVAVSYTFVSSVQLGGLALCFSR